MKQEVPPTYHGIAKPTRILGIDPGLQITGYAVIESSNAKPRICEAGIIRSSESRSASDMPIRLAKLYNDLVDVFEQYKPGAVAVEQLFAHYQHPRTAILMGHARGVILLAAAKNDIPVVNYNATQVKKTITGSGRAGKKQMQLTIQQELGLRQLPEPPDVADALAIALCHYYQLKTTVEY